MNNFRVTRNVLRDLAISFLWPKMNLNLFRYDRLLYLLVMIKTLPNLLVLFLTLNRGVVMSGTSAAGVVHGRFLLLLVQMGPGLVYLLCRLRDMRECRVFLRRREGSTVVYGVLHSIGVYSTGDSAFEGCVRGRDWFLYRFVPRTGSL